MEKIILNLRGAYTAEVREIEGNRQLIVPVTMMVEGVHNGSGGPLFYPLEELANSSTTWENTPVVINHPEDENGNPLSASDNRVVENEIIGRVRNPYMDNNKLRAEVWIDEKLLKSLSQSTYNYIIDGRPMDVSIGVQAENDTVQGDWNNEHYEGIARNYTPDHLALLPEAVGACSWDDGCGLRINKRVIKNKMDEKVKIDEREVALTLGGQTILLSNSTELFDNVIGYREIGQQIQSQLDSMDTATTYNFLEEVFEDSFIYRVRSTQNNQSDYYKRGYQVENEQVAINDEATRVQRKVNFEPIQNSSGTMKRTNNKNDVKLKRKKTMNEKSSPCKVNALINHKSTQFTEDDREWLANLEDGQLDKLMPNEVEAPAPVVQNSEEVTEEQIRKILNKEGDAFRFIDNFMPEGLRDQMKNGVTMYQDKRRSLVSEIVANSEFQEENLSSWNINDLEKLHKSVVKTNFSLNSDSSIRVSNEMGEDVQMMLNIEKSIENEEK